MVSELQEFINRPREQATGDDKGTPGENAQADAGVSADAAEAPRGNEGTEGSREEGEPKIS
jgi:hypothetical protein